MKNIALTMLFVFGLLNSACAATVQEMKAAILSGDYNTAVEQGSALLAANSSKPDEIRYLLGISCLKTGDYGRAQSLFEQIRRGAFKERAFLGLSDAYFLRGDYGRAQEYCERLLRENPRSSFSSAVEYRLSQIKTKQGDSAQAMAMLARLKEEHPLSPEVAARIEECRIADAPRPGSGEVYSVQVGAFTQEANARTLEKALSRKGFPAYIENLGSGGTASYRVRVGKTRRYEEITRLEAALSSDGFPTSICP